MDYAEALEDWSTRMKQAGYFDDVYDPERDIAIDGIALEHYASEAIIDWKAPSSYAGQSE